VARYLCSGMELRKEGNRPVRQAPGWRRLATARVHATRNGRLGHACSSSSAGWQRAPHGVPATGGGERATHSSGQQVEWQERAEQRAAGG
jgi:hypothetical protein